MSGYGFSHQRSWPGRAHSINRKGRREGRKDLWSRGGWGQNPRQKQGNTERRPMKGVKRLAGIAGAVETRLRAGKIRNDTTIGCIPAVCQALTEHYLI